MAVVGAVKRSNDGKVGVVMVGFPRCNLTRSAVQRDQVHLDLDESVARRGRLTASRIYTPHLHPQHV